MSSTSDKGSTIMNTAQQANKTPFKSVDTMRFPVFVLVAVSAILIGRGAAAPLMTSDKVIAALEEAMMSGSGEWKAPIVSPTAPAGAIPTFAHISHMCRGFATAPVCHFVYLVCL